MPATASSTCGSGHAKRREEAPPGLPDLGPQAASGVFTRLVGQSLAEIRSLRGGRQAANSSELPALPHVPPASLDRRSGWFDAKCIHLRHANHISRLQLILTHINVISVPVDAVCVLLTQTLCTPAKWLGLDAACDQHPLFLATFNVH